MSYQSDFNDDVLKDKLKTLLDEDNAIKKWNEGLLIKSLILLPLVIFVVGLFILNRPEKLTDIFFYTCLPFSFNIDRVDTSICYEKQIEVEDNNRIFLL